MGMTAHGRGRDTNGSGREGGGDSDDHASVPNARRTGAHIQLGNRVGHQSVTCGVLVLMLSVAGVAAYIFPRRAEKVDPAVASRNEYTSQNLVRNRVFSSPTEIRRLSRSDFLKLESPASQLREVPQIILLPSRTTARQPGR